MGKRVLSILIVLGLVMMLFTSLTTPVAALNEPVITSISPNISNLNAGTVETTYAATFTGTNMTGVTAVKFYSWETGSPVLDPNVFVTDLTPVSATSFTATIHVPAATKHRPLDVTATTGNGEGDYLYSGFIVGQFPFPVSGATGSSITTSLVPYTTSAGTTPITGPVYEGQPIWYKVELSQPLTSKFDFLGGQMEIVHPDGSVHQLAGYGAATPGVGSFPSARDIPEITPAYGTYNVMSPVAYIASSADLIGGFLEANAYYGSTATPEARVSGIVEGGSPLKLTASIPNSLEMYGSLQITKNVDLNGASGTGINQSFTVHVSGAGGPYSHVFNMVNGVIVSSVGHENPWIIDNLTSGTYTVTEDAAANWTEVIAGIGGLVNVTSGGDNSTSVTNDLVPGNLDVTKVVNWNGVDGSGVTRDFTVTVTGAGGPYTHTFRILNGSLQDSLGFENPWHLANLVPGTYTVSESNPGSSWSFAVSGTEGQVVVSPGSDNATSTVTNNYVLYPHTTLVDISRTPITLPEGGGPVTITVTDLNDGNAVITNPYFVITGNPSFGAPVTMTPIFSSDSDLVNMNPGATWTFTATINVTGDTVFTAVGHGMVGNVDVTGASETGIVVVTTPKVPATSTLSIAFLVLAFAGVIGLFVWKRRKQIQS